MNLYAVSTRNHELGTVGKITVAESAEKAKEVVANSLMVSLLLPVTAYDVFFICSIDYVQGQ